MSIFTTEEVAGRSGINLLLFLNEPFLWIKFGITLNIKNFL